MGARRHQDVGTGDFLWGRGLSGVDLSKPTGEPRPCDESGNRQQPAERGYLALMLQTLQTRSLRHGQEIFGGAKRSSVRVSINRFQRRRQGLPAPTKSTVLTQAVHMSADRLGICSTGAVVLPEGGGSIAYQAPTRWLESASITEPMPSKRTPPDSNPPTNAGKRRRPRGPKGRH